MVANEKRMRTHPFSGASRPAEKWPASTRRCGCCPHPFRGGASDGQALAAPGAAGIDDLAPAHGFHAHAKAVGTLAARHGRLIGTFHDVLAGLSLGCRTIHGWPLSKINEDGARNTIRYLTRFSFGRQQVSKNGGRFGRNFCAPAFCSLCSRAPFSLWITRMPLAIWL